ncbi:MAG: RDD family protein [Kofleriaceae bacterium]|nr:MAG: RDD family protein [Kofleriaceae bacterium]MBZ0231627.1 RDD family protein [Kofleriaceae bacterium]
MAVARYLDRKGDGARRREIVTPEGIPIQFTLASIGERMTALVIDIVLVLAAVFGAVLVASIASPGEDDWISALALLLVTLSRHFYFAFFEIRGHGATPGKRAAGIRVIDARGGSLEASAVLARNLVRELELWMPLTFLFASRLVWPDAPVWMWIAACGWLLVVALLPLFNKDNLRVGDLIGGTLVVVQPKVQLRADLADVRGARAKEVQTALATAKPVPAGGPAYTFTEAQLEVYGIYELQVLEGLLRGEAAADATAVSTVAEKIRAKIQYTEKVPLGQDERFLADFYTALRAHLEKRLLFGKRREDKFDTRA